MGEVARVRLGNGFGWGWGLGGSLVKEFACLGEDFALEIVVVRRF